MRRPSIVLLFLLTAAHGADQASGLLVVREDQLTITEGALLPADAGGDFRWQRHPLLPAARIDGRK